MTSFDQSQAGKFLDPCVWFPEEETQFGWHSIQTKELENRKWRLLIQEITISVVLKKDEIFGKKTKIILL